MSEVQSLSSQMVHAAQSSEDELFVGLHSSLNEDHAIIQDAVEGGQRAFYALLATIQDKLCSSATIAQIRHDFNQSGPTVAMLILAEETLKTLNYDTKLYLGALILKLGIDRICETKL